MSNSPLNTDGIRIILASGSPRRKMLLESLDLPFEVDVRPVDETYPESLRSSEVAEYLAEKKSLEWGELEDHQLLITADTIVSLEDRILEKPTSDAHASEMLTKLSGATHTVFSGVCLRTAKQKISFTDQTDVTFRELSDAEIEYYIQRYQPFDKAGSYGAQEWLGMIAVSHLNGSYFNVMGLPVHRLYSALENLLNRR